MPAEKPQKNVVKPAIKGTAYPCPCCGYLTLDERGADERCPVCYWQDDGQDDHDADKVRNGANGRLSLTQARENFKKMGAVDEHVRAYVRPPKPKERPGGVSQRKPWRRPGAPAAPLNPAAAPVVPKPPDKK